MPICCFRRLNGAVEGVCAGGALLIGSLFSFLSFFSSEFENWSQAFSGTGCYLESLLDPSQRDEF